MSDVMDADEVNRQLQSTLLAVAAHRGHPVVPLSEALAQMPDRQRSYDALRRRASFASAPPDRWTDLIADVVAFVDPLVEDESGLLVTWDPETCRWR